LTITQVISTVLFSGSPVALSVTNPTIASGGDDRMTIEEAKIQAPRSFVAMGYAITLQDIRTVSELFPGVDAARAVVSGGFVNVHIVPVSGGLPTTGLKIALLAELDAKKAAGTPIRILDPRLVPIQINGTVVYGSTFDEVDVQTAFAQALVDFFDPASASIEFGRSVYLSDVLADLDGLTINNVSAIDHVSLSIFARDPSPRLLIWTGNAEFSAITIGQTTVDETWIVVFTSPTTYSVTGSVSGLQAAMGTVGSVYVSDNDQITFTITNTGDPMAVADQAEIKTSKRFGDISIDEDEFPQLGSVSLSYVRAP
jgi:hypothetical protein